MDLQDNELIEKIKMKEINDTIGTFFQNNLIDFSFNRQMKRLERVTDIKTDIIDWYSGKWKVENNTVVFLSFTGIIRHNYIDTVIEKLFDDKDFTAFSIYEDFEEELGDDDDFTLYEIHTTDELKSTLNKVLQFFQNFGVSFFDKFITDDDFYQYLCVAKNYNYEEETTPASSIRKSLRRIMFCHPVSRKETLEEIKKYNLKCLTTDAVSPDESIREYNKKIKSLEEYYRNGGALPSEEPRRVGGLALTRKALDFCGFAPGSRLVDVGCGKGATVRYLRAAGFDAEGIDCDTAIIPQAEPYCRPGDASRLPFGAGSLDGLFFECSLSQMASRQSVLAEAGRVLKGGGVLVMSDLYFRNGGQGGFLPNAGEWQKLITEAAFAVLLFEDKSDGLAEFAARLLLQHGCAGIKELCGCDIEQLKAGHCGYFLLIAQKGGG